MPSNEMPSANKFEKVPFSKILKIEKERYNWIDQARGMTMFLLVITSVMPSTWRKINPILWFFFEHPDSNGYPLAITLYDIGVPAFFFIIGLLMAVSFKKRIEQRGVNSAILNAIIRWGVIFILGLFILFVTWDDPIGRMKEIVPGVTVFVFSWDVIVGIGAVGLWSIPFMFLPNKVRFIAAYAMWTFYQIMCFIPGTLWFEYGLASIDSGIVGAFFMRTGFLLIGSCVGEYYILNKSVTKEEKNKKYALLGIINGLIGAILWIVGELFDIKPALPITDGSTMSWATLSIAVIVGFSFIFIATDYKDEDFPKLNAFRKGRIVLFKAYGMNPFLMYCLAVIPEEIIGVIVGDLMDDNLFRLFLWLGLFTLVTIVGLILYKKNKAFSTTKVTIWILIVLIILAIALIGTGLVEF